MCMNGTSKQMLTVAELKMMGVLNDEQTLGVDPAKKLSYCMPPNA